MDLLDYVRGVRPWPQMYRFIEKLPVLGWYKKALANDVDLAEAAAASLTDLDELGSAAQPPPLEGWTEGDALRVALTNELRAVARSVLLVQMGRKTPKVQRLLVPVSAQQKALARRRHELLEAEAVELDDLFAPRA